MCTINKEFPYPLEAAKYYKDRCAVLESDVIFQIGLSENLTRQLTTVDEELGWLQTGGGRIGYVQELKETLNVLRSQVVELNQKAKDMEKKLKDLGQPF